jgi:hypothetical protein
VAVSFLASKDGRAPDSANCNVVGNSNVDLIVAIITSVLGYLLALPILFLFSQILVPSFEVNFEGKDVYQTRISSYEQTHALTRKAHSNFTTPQPVHAHEVVENELSDDTAWMKKVGADLTCRRFLLRLAKLTTIPVAADWLYIRSTYGN